MSSKNLAADAGEETVGGYAETEDESGGGGDWYESESQEDSEAKPQGPLSWLQSRCSLLPLATPLAGWLLLPAVDGSGPSPDSNRQTITRRWKKDLAITSGGKNNPQTTTTPIKNPQPS